MRDSRVLPVMGVLTVIAGALGLQLGESAIAQIDPVHFSGPRPLPRDVSRERRAEPPATYASAYGWAEGYGAQAADCGDCPAANARDVYAPLSEPLADGADSQPWRAPIAYDRLDHEEEADRREWREIGRYVHYPVTHDQADLAESLPVDRGGGDTPEMPDASEPAGL